MVIAMRLQVRAEDARRSSVLVALGSVRTAILLYYARAQMPPPFGFGWPRYPGVSDLSGLDGNPGRIRGGAIPENPYSGAADAAGRHRVQRIDLPVTGTRRRPADNTGAWAYDEDRTGGRVGEPYPPGTLGFDVGTFWANTATPGVDEYLF
ncbi:MAG: hypothetical protein HZA54_16130 [Planctomycetes bacterium]|nr:hypothetical protein [Planctomycetota bacterium]